jgi:GNS1/SUR4 family
MTYKYKFWLIPLTPLLPNRYAYYMLAAIGPHMQKYLWWKKYLTSMQMVQFVMVFLHAMQLFFHNPCGYPIGYAYVAIALAVSFFFLFKGLGFKIKFINIF